MARYDRIAPLPAPVREAAFPGWLIFRDLEGRERDSELARRARLRFLALRPLRRVLALGLEGVSAASYARQVEAIREELGHLPARDPERLRISRYLHEIESRSPADLAAAVAGLGDVAEEAGHACAAEEFYRSGLELAQAFGRAAAAAAALRRLGTLCFRHGREEEAEQHLSAAATAATAAGAHGEWAKAACAGARLLLRRGDGAGASAMLEQVLRQGRSWADRQVQSLACAGLAESALAAGDAEAAVEHAWTALENASDSPCRAAALEAAGGAFRTLGLLDAALRAYEMLLSEALPAADLWRAHADVAGSYAEAGRLEEFALARKRLLRDARAESPPPRPAAEMHLRLARACLLVGVPDVARDHLRDGLDAARRGGYPDLVAALEVEVTQASAAGSGRTLPGEPGERARLIAGALQSRALATARA